MGHSIQLHQDVSQQIYFFDNVANGKQTATKSTLFQICYVFRSTHKNGFVKQHNLHYYATKKVHTHHFQYKQRTFIEHTISLSNLPEQIKEEM